MKKSNDNIGIFIKIFCYFSFVIVHWESLSGDDGKLETWESGECFCKWACNNVEKTQKPATSL